MARELTEKQKRVLSTLETYWSTHHIPPSISDLAKELGINKATAYEHLLALKKKGYLTHQARAGRTWRLARHSKKALCNHPQIPLLARIVHGTTPLSNKDIDGHITGDYDVSKEIFAFRFDHNNMLKEHIKRSDIVIAEQNATYANGDLVVASLENKSPLMFRYQKNFESIIFHTDDEQLTHEQFLDRKAQIIGRVVEIRRALK